MTVFFACGHQVTLGDPGETPPVCACGERRVRDVKAPAPRFRGACQGPSAVLEALPAMPVNAAPSGPLVLKG